MPINEIIEELAEFLNDFKCSWKLFGYLGCNIRACKKQLHKDNLEKVLKDVRNDQLKWKNVPLNLIG